MSKGPIYRIRVEVIGEEEKGFSIGDDLRNGLECRGFVIIGDNEETHFVSIHNVSNADMASAISDSKELMVSSALAKVMYDYKKLRKDAEDDSADSKGDLPE